VPRSLRLMLEPLSPNADGSRQLFDGAVLSFRAMGEGLSKASIGSPTSAKLSLQMTFLDQARAPQDTEDRPLASMAGSIVFKQIDSPVFSGDPNGWTLDPLAHDQAPEGATSQRALRFELASPDFAGALPNQDLVIKLDPTRFRFIELRAKLEIGGSIEADFAVSGVLDVLITRDNPPPLGATIGIPPPIFDEIPATAKLVLTPSQGDPITFALASGADRGDGLLTFLVPDPRPGVLYKAEMQVAPTAPLTLLFHDIELNQLVAQSEGATAGPLASLGADALVFETAAEGSDDAEVTQGGPDAPSDEQLASFDAQAGTVAVA